MVEECEAAVAYTCLARGRTFRQGVRWVQDSHRGRRFKERRLAGRLFPAVPFSPAGAPGIGANHFTARNRVFFSGRDRFFSGRDHRFRSGFFHHRFRFNNPFFGANCFGFGFGFGNPFCGTFISSGFLFADPFFGLGYGYGAGYPYPPPDYYPSQSETSNDDNQVALTAEIQHLSDEIQDLRDERKLDEQARERPPASSGATLSAVPPSANTIFVLHDGRRITAKNFAISGQTLWILNENTARKTPLSDIDRSRHRKSERREWDRDPSTRSRAAEITPFVQAIR